MTLLCGLTRDSDINIGATVVCCQPMMITLMMFYGLMVATSCRVGINLGTNNPNGVRIVLVISFFAAILIGICGALFLFFGRHFVVNMFTNKSDLRIVVVDNMWLLAFFQIPDGINTVCRGVFRGAGKTVSTTKCLIFLFKNESNLFQHRCLLPFFPLLRTIYSGFRLGPSWRLLRQII